MKQGRRLLATIACAALLYGCRQEEPPSDDRPNPPIVVITVDTLRADHVGSYGYFRDTSPHMDRLAADGIRFEHAVTTMATTLPAHVSLFTSLYPVQTGVTTNGTKLRDSQENHGPVRMLAEMLRDLGYATAGFVSATPVKSYTGINAGFDHFDEPDPKRGGRIGRSDVTTDAVLAWLATAPDGPFFLWVHYFDPHDPYTAPDPWDSAFGGDEEQLRQVLRERHHPTPDDPEIHRLHAQYDGEIGFNDSQIGRLLDGLRESGLYDPATIVLIGDHGQGLGQHDILNHGEIWNEQIFVPLIIKLPAGSRRNGRTVEPITSTVDVAPTLVEVLGLQISDEDRAQFVGRNALGGEPREFALTQRTTHKDRKWGTAPKFSITGLEWKFTMETGEAEWLHDMRTDATQSLNLIDQNVDVAERLRDRLLTEIASYSGDERAIGSLQETAPEILEELRALGYIN